jgi:phosphate transport system substrate-binding protein
MLTLRHAATCLMAGSIVFLSAAAFRPALGDEVQGAGSTFVAPIMTKWTDDYLKVSGVKVSYQAVGSGAGIEAIRAGRVDFGATDKPLSPDELRQAGLCQFPVVVGGVVPVVNLAGVAPNRMRFSGELLAAIYMGMVTTWDAPEIKALNPGPSLPSLPIAVVHRSDSSGTTFNWVDFLAKTSAAWRDKVGVGLSVAWPVGEGGNGNAGVSAAVTRTAGSIGYVEYSYALQNHLSFAQVENAHGLFVSPGADAFQAAAATVDWQNHKDFSVQMTNAGGVLAYPITATTFILMAKAPTDPTRPPLALAFFKWVLEAGDQQASQLSYAPLPAILVKRVEAYWASQMKLPAAAAGG